MQGNKVSSLISTALGIWGVAGRKPQGKGTVSEEREKEREGDRDRGVL